MASLRDSLAVILEGYRGATAEPFAQNPIATFIRNEASLAVRTALTEQLGGLVVEGSAGAGNWASVPWIAAFDPAVTQTATKGYYLVYLFHHAEAVVHLSLNQGTTAVRKEFGARSRDQMRSRAELIRSRLADLVEQTHVTEISLGSDIRLPQDYEAAHALGFSYRLVDLPSEDQLTTDLRGMVALYRALTFRGGIDAVDEDVRSDIPSDVAIIERRRYRFHRRIERNPAAGTLVKKHLGCSCQACGMNFKERYGAIGEGYIEVHHLLPLSSLQEGTVISYTVDTDFAVLCANCHRMIHRCADPSDVVGFAAHVRTRATIPNEA